MKVDSKCSFTYKPNFKAKFLYSDDLKAITEYAIAHGKFDKLNQARKNIESSYLVTRLLVETGNTDKGFPFIKFVRFVPKSSVIVPKTMGDYNQEKIVVFHTESPKYKNVLKFALSKILKMGNAAPKNNIFKKVVVDK